MLSVESVRYVLSHVDLVNNLISIFLHRSCKNDDFVMFGHGFDKLNATGSDQEETLGSVLNVVDQGFIEVKHEAVLLVGLDRSEERWGGFRQVLEIVRERSLRHTGDRRSFQDRKWVFSCQASLSLIVSSFALSGVVHSNTAGRLGPRTVHATVIRKLILSLAVLSILAR